MSAAPAAPQLLPRVRAHAVAVQNAWSEPLPWEHVYSPPALLQFLSTVLQHALSWVLAHSMAVAVVLASVQSLAWVRWFLGTQPCLCAAVLSRLQAICTPVSSVLTPPLMVITWPFRWWAAVISSCLKCVISRLPVLLEAAVCAWFRVTCAWTGVRFAQLLVPTAATGSLVWTAIGILAYLALDHTWACWQKRQFKLRQEQAEHRLSPDTWTPFTVRAESSRQLRVAAGRWLRGTRHVSTVLGGRLNEFVPHPLILSLLRVMLLVAAYLAQCAVSVGLASLRCAVRAVQACLVISVLAAMVAAVQYCPGMTCQLGDGTSVALLSLPMLQHGWTVLSVLGSTVTDSVLSVTSIVCYIAAAFSSISHAWVLLPAVLWLAVASMYNALLILHVTCRAVKAAVIMVCTAALAPLWAVLSIVCKLGKACVDPLRRMRQTASTGTGAPSNTQTCAPVAGVPESTTAGHTNSRTTTAASPGPRGNTVSASRLRWAVLLAASVLCGAACVDTDALAATLNYAGQELAGDLWVVTASVAHVCSPIVACLSPWPVSQTPDSYGTIRELGGEDSEASLYRVMFWSTVTLGMSGPLVRELAKVLSFVLNCLPHALERTHDAELVLYVHAPAGCGAQFARVYEGGVFAQRGLARRCVGACCRAAADPLSPPLPAVLDAAVAQRLNAQHAQEQHASGACPVRPGSSCPATASRHHSHRHVSHSTAGCSSEYCVHSLVEVVREQCHRACSCVRNAAVLCMPAAPRANGQWFKPIPPNLSGIALHEACVEYQRQCLFEHLREPQDQRFFIIAFEMACGFDSAISALINAKVYNATLNWQSPKDYALELAAKIAERQRSEEAWASQFSDSAEYAHFTSMVEQFYPAYEPDPLLVDSLRQMRERAADHARPYEEVTSAQAAAEMAQQQLDAARTLHEGRTPMERYQYLLTHADPVLRHSGENIRTYLLTQKDIIGVRQDMRYRQKPFNSSVTDVKHMEALEWLVRYVVRNHGTITEVHCHVWRTRRMCAGQAPRDAFAKLREEAKVLADLATQRMSFDLNRELLDMVSRPSSQFWPEALWKPLHTAMLTALSSPDVLATDQEGLISRWVETAQRLYEEMQSRLPHEFNELRSQLTERGPWKSWSQLEDAYHKSQGHQPKTPRAPRQPREQGGRQNQSSDVCRHCHRPGHWAKDCPELRREMGAQQSAYPARDRGARAAMTTTPSASTNQLAVGMNPKAAYNRGQDRQGGDYGRGPQQQQGGRRRYQDMPVCDTCSRIAGSTYRHDPPCYNNKEGGVPPHWLNPPNQKVREALNDRRRELGVDIPPPPRDHRSPRTAAPAARQRRAYFSDERDPMAGGPSQGTRMAMMRPALNGAQDRASFDPAQRLFTCRECGQTMVASRTGTVLHGIHCVSCDYNLPAALLPPSWKHPSVWQDQPRPQPDAFGSALSVSPPELHAVPPSRMVRHEDALRIAQGDAALTALVLGRGKAQDACLYTPVLLTHASKAENLTQQCQDLFYHCISCMPPAARPQQEQMWHVLVVRPHAEARRRALSVTDEARAAAEAVDRELRAAPWQEVGRSGAPAPAQEPLSRTTPTDVDDPPLQSRRSPPRAPGQARPSSAPPPAGYVPGLSQLSVPLAASPLALQLAAPASDPVALSRISSAERQLAVLDERVSQVAAAQQMVQGQLQSTNASVQELNSNVPAVRQLLETNAQQMHTVAESVRNASTAQATSSAQLVQYVGAATEAIRELTTAMSRAVLAHQQAAPMQIDADARDGILDRVGALARDVRDLQQQLHDQQETVAAQQLLLGAGFDRSVTVLHAVAPMSPSAPAAASAVQPALSPWSTPTAAASHPLAPSPVASHQQALHSAPTSPVGGRVSGSGQTGTAPAQVPVAPPPPVRDQPPVSETRQRAIERRQGKRHAQPAAPVADAPATHPVAPGVDGIARLHVATSSSEGAVAATPASGASATSTSTPPRPASPRNPSGTSPRPQQGEVRRSPRLQGLPPTALMMRPASAAPLDSAVLMLHLDTLERSIALASSLRTTLTQQREHLLSQVLDPQPFSRGVPAPSVAQHDRIVGAAAGILSFQQQLRECIKTHCASTLGHDYIVRQRRYDRESNVPDYVVECICCGTKATYYGAPITNLNVTFPDTPEFVRERADRDAYLRERGASAHIERADSTGSSQAGATVLMMQPQAPTAVQEPQLSQHLHAVEESLQLLPLLRTHLTEQRDQLFSQMLDPQPLCPGILAPGVAQCTYQNSGREYRESLTRVAACLDACQLRRLSHRFK